MKKPVPRVAITQTIPYDFTKKIQKEKKKSQKRRKAIWHAKKLARL